MAAYFFDTSAIVKRYVVETGTPWVRATVNPAAANAVYLARLSAVEMASAVTRRQRGGFLSVTEAASILTQFRQDLILEYRVVEIGPALFSDAERLAESHALRANDAIQLAAAVELQSKRLANGLDPLTLVSADQDLNTAAATFGLIVEDPNLHP
jgi:uncharacterized protein